MDIDKYDYVLYTDGAGYEKDGFSGWCATVTIPGQTNSPPSTHSVMGCMSGSTVDKAEFTALLEGLELILRLDEERRSLDRKPLILWYSDRESLVGGVMKVWGEGKGRNSSPDLWKRFDHYASKVLIHGQHVKRETDFAEFQQCDLHASTLRIVLKDYVTSI